MANLTSSQFLPSESTTNASTVSNMTSLFPLQDGFAGPLISFWSILLSFAAFRDGAKLFILGGAIEAGRRLLMTLWTKVLGSFIVTAEFEERDETFIWMMFWLSRQSSWNEARSVRVSTSRYGHDGVADAIPGEEDSGNVDPKRRLSYTPTHNITQYLWFRGSWMSVTLSRTQGDYWNRLGDEQLSVTMFTRNLSKLDSLLLEAKKTYKQDAEGRINIYVADQYNEWSLAGSRPKRPLSSVVLDKGVKENILADAKEFMESEKWYAERGIPWRRGYLLHGYPGTGKTSLIHALAGELSLDIYVISLSKKGLDDSVLGELISRLPSRSIALMEDIDAAFFRGLTREPDASSDSTSAQRATNGPPPPPGQTQQQSSSVGVTLSGLLGAIDGVAAGEGRLLFATTNKYSALDPALTRPGRLDVHVRFDNAGKWQAEELFRRFFPPSDRIDDDTESDDGTLVDSSASAILATPSPAPSSPVDSPGAAKLELIERVYTKAALSIPQSKDVTEPAAMVFTAGSGIHCPKLSRDVVDRLAREFATQIPEREFSMAAIQGLLMQYKSRPYLVLDEVKTWVDTERTKRLEREGMIVKGPEKVPVEKGEKSKIITPPNDIRLDEPPKWLWTLGML